MEKCKKCNNEVKGFKCDICGSEAETHDSDHKCGGDHCMSKCTGCNEAEVKCTCE